MARWAPFGSVRRFAALLLLLAVMLGGSVDAIACEPVTEAAISAAETMAPADPDVTQGDEQQLPGNDRHGACIHGHCHHGVANVQPVAQQADLLAAQVDHCPAGEHRLASITLNSLKRPPRV